MAIHKIKIKTIINIQYSISKTFYHYKQKTPLKTSKHARKQNKLKHTTIFERLSDKLDKFC